MRTSQKEKTMSHRFEGYRSDKTARCAVCDGKFGLIRHYSWGTQLCSRKCVDCFRAQRQSYGNWMGWLQITPHELPEDREGLMATHISQRGKEYLKTAQT